MNFRLRAGFFTLFLVLSLIGFGQNDFFFNHYMFNPTYYNPAYAGVETKAFAAAHHRSQWVGYEASADPGGPPATQLLSVVVPIQSVLSGTGISILNDNLPGLRSVQARLALSVKKDFQFGELSFGLSPSLNIQTLDPGDFRPSQIEDFGSRESIVKPNLHLGVFFQSEKNYFVGLSAENILEPTFNFGGSEEGDYFKRYYLLYGGTNIGISRGLILKPTVLLRSDFNSMSFQLGGIATYQERMWAGLAFQRSESITLLLGYSFLENNKLKAGYSLDYVVQDRDAKQSTSHEIFLRYDLPNLIFGGRKAVKTPRFTF
ncbi:MAG: PorP/SprF family type IX secretion system membrane protein [Ekhidna sp.]